MAGFNRVGRLPGYVNGKPQHAGWRCVLHRLDGTVRYTPKEIADAFGLKAAAKPKFDPSRSHHAGVSPRVC